MDFKSDSNIIEIFFDQIDSTQIYARDNWEELISKSKNKWFAIRADQQTAGIGQNNNIWVSPPDNIYVTFILEIKNKHLPFIHLFPQITAITLANIFSEDFNLKNTKIKWVNDVMINNRKVAGILTEVQSIGDLSVALIGVGINVNTEQDSFLMIDQNCTSLNLENEYKNTIDKIEVYNKLKEKLYNNIETFKNNLDFLPFSKAIGDNICFLNKMVKIVDKKGDETFGLFKKIDENGFAVLLIDDVEKTLINGRMFLKEN